MTSHSVLQWPRQQATDHDGNKSSRCRRLLYYVRVRWKEALVALTFWAAYGYACASLLSR